MKTETPAIWSWCGVLTVGWLGAAEPTAALLAPAGFSPSGFELLVQVATGASHEVHFTENFDKWRLLAAANGASSVVSIRDAGATNRNRTFYRAMSQAGPRREPFHAFTWDPEPPDCTNLTRFI